MSHVYLALVSLEWEEHFMDVVQRQMRQPVFNHSPILVGVRVMMWGQCAFKFENIFASGWVCGQEFRIGGMDSLLMVSLATL